MAFGYSMNTENLEFAEKDRDKIIDLLKYLPPADGSVPRWPRTQEIAVMREIIKIVRELVEPPKKD